MYLIASMRYLVYATDELRLFTGRTILGFTTTKSNYMYNQWPLFSITCHFIPTFLFHLTVKVRITLGSNWHIYNCRNPHLFLQRLRDMETIFTKICQCLHVSYTHSKQSEACILILMLVYRLWYRLNVCIKTLSISNSIVSVRFKTTQWNLSYDFLWILPA